MTSLDLFFDSLNRLAAPSGGSSSGRRNSADLREYAAAFESRLVEDLDEPGLLTEAGAQALSDFFVKYSASGVSWLQRGATIECLQDIAAPFRGDPRYAQVFRAPLFLAATQWTGARSAHDMGTSGTDKGFSSRFPLTALLPKLQKRFINLLRRNLARFWLEARANNRMQSLQTLENLTLVVTLIITVIFLTTQMSRIDGAKTLNLQLAAIMRLTRIPGETGIPGLELATIDGLDDFLLNHLWRDVFFAMISMDGYLSAMTQTVSVVDPVQEFPSVPYIRPTAVLAAVPPPSQRSINGPIPEDLLNEALDFRCIEYFGWLDPCAGVSIDQPVAVREKLDRMLSTSLGIGESFKLASLVLFSFRKVAAYAAWLKESKLSLVGVLVAEDILNHGPGHRRLLKTVHVTALFSNPRLEEAIRRRNHLWNALNFVKSYLPSEVAQAGQGADLTAMLKLAKMLPTQTVDILLGFLTILRLSLMMLVSPEPFDDFAKPGGGRPVSQDYSDEEDSVSSDGSSTPINFEGALLEAWFSSPSFLQASRNAAIISANMRVIAAGLATGTLKGSYILFSLSSTAATHAASFHLLVLRRFRSMVAGSHAAEQAKALTLYDELQSDIESCLDILKTSGNMQNQITRGLLQKLLDDAGAQLGPADVQMLKIAQQNFKFCKHMDEDGDADGACLLCASERAKPNSFDSDETMLADPLARLPEMFLSGLGWDSSAKKKEKRHVRFADKVTVFEVQPIEDDDGESTDEDAEDVATNAEAAEEIVKPSLDLLLMGRNFLSMANYPNLQAYRP